MIHERARLSVLTSLISHPKGLTFNDLKQLCSLTDGNLSRHLSVLEKDGMVEIVKSHERNRPLTICRQQAVSRISFDARAGGSRRRQSDEGRAGREPGAQSDAGAGVIFFGFGLCSAK